jgi:hypothetical protein
MRSEAYGPISIFHQKGLGRIPSIIKRIPTQESILLSGGLFPCQVRKKNQLHCGELRKF